MAASGRLELAIRNIEEELRECSVALRGAGQILEATRLEERTRYDLEMLRESGYYEMPYQVPRWSQASRGVYGDSQADLAMPDIRMVNTMARTTLSGAELAVKPPLQKRRPNSMSFSKKFLQIRKLPSSKWFVK